MTKRLDKILLAVAIVIIAACAVVTFTFTFDSASETAYAATQHALTFGNDTHGSGHAGTKITKDYLLTQLNEDGNYALKSGNYYLGDNLELDHMLYFVGSVNLCLNGYMLTTTAGPVITIDDGVSSATTEHKSHEYCRIFDCHDSKCTDTKHKQHQFTNPIDNKPMNVDGGLITGGKGSGGINIYCGILYIYNGTIAGNQSVYGGGGVNVTSGEFRMYGTATVMYNKAGWYGAGVAMGNNTKFLMKGGTIRDNGVPMDSQYSRGGGVYLDKGVRFEMSAGTICNNSAKEGGGIYFVNDADSNVSAHVLLLGTAKIYDNTDGDNGYPFNIRCEKEHGVIEVGGVFHTGARIELSTTLSIEDWDNLAQLLAPHEVFTDELGLSTAGVYADTDSFEWLGAHNHGNISYIPLTRDTMNRYSYKLPQGNYFLNENILNMGAVEFAAGSRLCLNGFSIGMMNARLGHYPIILNDNCVILNCKEEGARGNSSGKIETGITVRGDVTMETVDNGYINIYYTGTNDKTFKGVGVYVESGSFTMNNGIISSLSAKSTQGTGGAVYVENGNLFLNGGEISGNSAKEGGGIYVKKGNVTVGGSFKLANNTATNRGGGIFVADGNVTLNGGEISGNSAKDGGGIYVQKGSITARASVNFTGNKASGRGGGIFVETSATIQGLNISGNTATGDGGGVFANGNLKLIDVNIGKNTSNGKGGGVNVQDKGGSEISGNSIIGENTASGNSDGLYSIGEITIKGLTLNKDKLNIGGGKVTLADNGLTISDSVYITQKGTLEISSTAALVSLANGNAKITLENANCKISLASSLKADEAQPSSKINVGYASKDVMGTLVSKQSRDCDVDVSQYFAYVPFDVDAKFCIAVTKDVVETNSTHNLVLDDDGVKFDDNDFKATYSLKCERCNKKINGITISPKSEEEVVQPSCTTKGTKRYDFELTTDAIKQSLGEEATYYSVTESYSNSYEAPFGEPTGHKWEIAIWEGDPGHDVTPDKGYGRATATCANEGHDVTRDGKNSLTIKYENLERHEGTAPYVYDGKPYVLIISDDDGFRKYIPGYREEIKYAKDEKSSEWTEPDEIEIKKAGYYKLTIYTDLDKEKPMLEIMMKVTKKSLKFGLNISESVYNGNEVQDIDLIFNGLASGETLQNGVDYNLNFINGKPINVGTYTIGVTLGETAAALNYTCEAQIEYRVLNAKITATEAFRQYQSGLNFIYDANKDQSLGLPDGLPFTAVGDNKIAVRYIIETSDTDDADAILAQLEELKTSGNWDQASASTQKEPGSWRVYFRLTADNHETYYGYYVVNIYKADYVIRLNSKDIFSGLAYGGEMASLKSYDDFKNAIKDNVLTIKAVEGDVDTGDKKGEMFDSKNFVLYIIRNGAVYGSNVSWPEKFAAGEYTIRASYSDTGVEDKNYSFKWSFAEEDCTPTFSIAQYVLTDVSLSGDSSAKYKGAAFDDVDVNFDNLVSGDTLTKNIDYVIKYNDTSALPVTAGSYTITAELLDTPAAANYKLQDGTSTTFKIDKAPLAFEVPTGDAYNGQPHALLATITGEEGDLLIRGTDYTVLYNNAGDPPLAADTYKVKIVLSQTALANNYECNAEVDYTLAQAKIARPSATKNEETFDYNGSDRTMTINGYSDSLMTAKAAEGSTFNIYTGAFSAKNVKKGGYTLEISLKDPANYTWKEKGEDKVQFKLTLKPVSLDFEVPDGGAYDGRTRLLLATISGEGNDTLVRGRDYDVKYNNKYDLPLAAGTYTVSVVLRDSELANNYSAPVPQQYTISRAQLTKPTSKDGAVAEKVYNGESQYIEIDGFDGELMTAVASKGSSFGASTGKFSARDVNENGYKLVLSIADTGNYVWKNGGQEAVEFTLTLKPASLDFELASGESYDPDPSRYDILGVIQGESHDVLKKGTDYSVKFSGLDKPTNVGVYSVEVVLLSTPLANNYQLIETSKTYTIAKKQLAKPTIESVDLTYNGRIQFARVSGFDYKTMTANVEEFVGDRLNATDAGSHSVVISISDKNNYQWEDGSDDSITLTFAIAPAALTFETMGGGAFDGNEKSAEIKFGGLLGDDFFVAGEDYVVKYNGSSALPVNAGDYAVTVELQDTIYANNYVVVTTSQTFGVTRLPLKKLVAQQFTAEMNGKTQTFDIDGYDDTMYVLSGAHVKDGKLASRGTANTT